MKAEECNTIFNRAIADYHVENSIDQAPENPFTEGNFEALLYEKCWIDTVQWHLEDIIRSPDLPCEPFIASKRRIDSSNQRRTDLVEKIDDHFLARFAAITPAADARQNSETPAWLIDRMSILMLKIYHMDEQTRRSDVDQSHRDACRLKLDVLLDQKSDMARCLDQLSEDIEAGRRYMKVYRQMKMYNDPKLNPVLYGAEKPGSQQGS